MAIKLHPSILVHPGPWLKRQIVEPYHMNVTSVAKHLGVTRAAMSNLLNGKAALSPEMAVRFEKAFGISSETMMRMQVSYELAQLELSGKTIDVKRLSEAA